MRAPVTFLYLNVPWRHSATKKVLSDRRQSQDPSGERCIRCWRPKWNRLACCDPFWKHGYRNIQEKSIISSAHRLFRSSCEAKSRYSSITHVSLFSYSFLLILLLISSPSMSFSLSLIVPSIRTWKSFFILPPRREKSSVEDEFSAHVMHTNGSSSIDFCIDVL